MHEKLTQLMNEYYVTFEELSVRLGVNKRTLTHKMNGSMDWTYEEMMLLVQMFNIHDPEQFFYGKE